MTTSATPAPVSKAPAEAGAPRIAPPQAGPFVDEPIATTGHGGFFDPQGRQIPPTFSFVERAQAWYRERMMADLSSQQRAAFAVFEKRLYAGDAVEGQERLLFQHEALEWLLATMPAGKATVRLAAKVRALRHTLNFALSNEHELQILGKREAFAARPESQKRLGATQAERRTGGPARAVTVNSGQNYIDECRAAGVPIPPTINLLDPAGTAGWKSQGFIPQSTQFIVGTPAEVRTYKSSAPEGMCYALPRYSDATLSTVSLDGVICLGKQSSKVCLWDNQLTVGGVTQSFVFPAGEQIPIGVPSTPGGRYQGGGKEIEPGAGGICTDCHAGENPYIIHPLANLAPSGAPAVLWSSLSQPPQSLPSMSVNRYDPLVGSTWPQNALSQAQSTLPAACVGCHIKGAAGRLPHLSNELPDYCGTVLAKAIDRTMPPSAPGSAAVEAHAFRNAWCAAAPNGSSADAGDPHITTTNNVYYDFQAAGEFTALKYEDTGFELQLRQSPVLTSFTPEANPYTGLSSCVSINSAVALRIGAHRVAYQGSRGSFARLDDLHLRIDGKRVDFLHAIELEGAVIRRPIGSTDLEVRLTDGTRVVITPLFWAAQGVWYLDVLVFNTPAREGLMGPVLAGDWLPRARDGHSFGPIPTALIDRHTVLNVDFADSWRVTPSSSLFEYAAGTSTADFTDRNWPTEPGKACTSTTVKSVPAVKRPRRELAALACKLIKDPNIRANCIFDVTVMADVIAAVGHRHADRLRGTQ